MLAQRFPTLPDVDHPNKWGRDVNTIDRGGVDWAPHFAQRSGEKCIGKLCKIPPVAIRLIQSAPLGVQRRPV
ncbi:hypothetical protein MDUV_09220 [Mycolicibacterium duvalii]|uniref:Uncharacterized protein n=1 Tax=Mycolicibacterium duvalii TaxID=39688 RepID=A0A7I7JY98_9MYCO|nr:hypothetical protein MDUV_09220 [Mycolicibacterium duvalii]